MDIRNAQDLVGAKIALICGTRLVCYLRDDFDHIPDQGLWDFPGGECEDQETALTCALRETQEEFGLTLAPDSVIYASRYKSHQPGRADVAFFVAPISPDMVEAIVFGDEGQCWQMMELDSFLARKDAVAELQAALNAALASLTGSEALAAAFQNS